MTLDRRTFLSLAALASLAPLPARSFVDVLDTPSRKSALVARSSLFALAWAGERVVACGQRGHVLFSDDQGQYWKQASVPVSVDLVALSFPTDRQGWAVGHDGVVLHTTDAGATWTAQLDGQRAVPLLKGQAQHLRDTGQITSEQQAELVRLADQSDENPWLDVCFLDARRGYVVGAFGLALSTDDGGQSWSSIVHRIDNPKALHLYAVRVVAGVVYIVGEQGLLLRLDAGKGRFEAMTLPYQGTLFGVTGSATTLLVHGLRGKVLRSADGGRSWDMVPTNLLVGITASAIAADGSWLLASQAGHVLISADAGRNFTLVRQTRMQPIAAVVPVGSTAGAAQRTRSLLAAGPRGLQSITLS